MKVTVKIIGSMIKQAGFSEKVIDIPETFSLRDLVTILDIPGDNPRIIVRNGSRILQEDRLENGDRIVISHMYSGG